MSHSFHVDRQLPDGTWVDFWSEDTQQTLAFRAACSCGWTGQDVCGDLTAGRPDEQSMEAAYTYWDRFHCPDWERRHQGDPDRE